MTNFRIPLTRQETCFDSGECTAGLILPGNTVLPRAGLTPDTGKGGSGVESWGWGNKAFYKPSMEQPKQFITWCLGRPTMEGNTALGASSPAKPALQSPDPLSQTRAVLSSSSHIFYVNVLRSSRQKTAL